MSYLEQKPGTSKVQWFMVAFLTFQVVTKNYLEIWARLFINFVTIVPLNSPSYVIEQDENSKIPA